MGKNQSLELPFPLILASTSKYRSALLNQLGWPFECVAPGVDEEKIKESGLKPQELATELSKLKAQAVFVKNSLSCVIGSDQVCDLDGMILDKPGSIDKAREQLSLMQGRSHRLITAVTVICPARQVTFSNVTTLHMRKLTLKEIVNYVDVDSPLDCAGSYKLESRGIKLFERIEMSDQTSIIGLPLIELSTVLMNLSYPL